MPSIQPTRIAGLFRELGGPAALLYMLHRLFLSATGGRLALHCFDLVVVPLGWRLPKSVERRNTVEVRVLQPAEAALHRVGPSAEEIGRRTRLGNHCVAALLDGRVAAYVWIARADFLETVVRCRFTLAPPDQIAWDFDMFVDPCRRGGLVFAALWQGVCRILEADGYRFTASRISLFNAPSRLAHRRLGATSLGKMVFLCIGNWQAMFASVPPYFHLSSTGGIPEIRVEPQRHPSFRRCAAG